MSGDTVEVCLAHGGRLRGITQGSVRAFLGIPYAECPSGVLRWGAPQSAAPWTGVREAMAFSAVAPQLTRLGTVHPQGGPECLTLNVWTPLECPSDGLPVMVWVHGGGFMRGSAAEPLYDGAAFARRGVVLVSLQYRLGVDGFMHFPGTLANRGLLDLLAGLEWVRDHAAVFGGDPARVTLFGESAGAGAVACLLGMDATAAMCQQAILQSPSIVCHSLEDAARAREALAAALCVVPTREAIEAVPMEALLGALQRLGEDAALRERHGLGIRHFFPLRPVVDGEVLCAQPLEGLARLWESGAARPRVLVGSNAHEMRLYHVPHGAIDRIQPQQLHAFMHQAGLGDAALASYRARAGTDQPGPLLCDMQSDYYYRVPARRLAALAARAGLNSFLYEFEWPSPQWGGRLGAAHGVDLPFVFNNLQTTAGLEFTGSQPPAELAEAMQSAWVRFARDGDPGWPAHRTESPWRMRFGIPCQTEQEAPDPCIKAWDGLGVRLPCAVISQQMVQELCDTPDKHPLPHVGGSHAVIYRPDGAPLAAKLPEDREGPPIAEIELSSIGVVKNSMAAAPGSRSTGFCSTAPQQILAAASRPGEHAGGSELDNAAHLPVGPFNGEISSARSE